MRGGLEVVGVEARAEVGLDAGAADPKNPIGHNAALLGIGHLYQLELHLRRPHTTRIFVRCASWWVQGGGGVARTTRGALLLPAPTPTPDTPAPAPILLSGSPPTKSGAAGDRLNRGRRGAHLAYVVTDEHSEG